jgi:hypothetical protein
MSKADECRSIYKQHRALIEKAATATQTLSVAEQATLKSVVAELNTLAEHLGFGVELIDPNIAVAAERMAIFDAHYRRKVELDRKFFDDPI